MASDPTAPAHRQIESLLRTGSTAGLTDGQLLRRFADRGRGEEAAQSAFSAIVDRHAAMVLRACRRVLGDEHDAQEAAQATFLVLARRAGSIGHLDSLGGWLHGVASRASAKQRVAAIRRRGRERIGGTMAAQRGIEGQESAAHEGPDRWAELHEELGRLPEKFRSPLVLCYLEGLTQEQAAERLRCPLGTVQSRLARGRDRLKRRLISRGVATSAGAIGIGLTAGPSRAMPADWAEAMARSALQFTIRGSGPIRAGAWPASAGLASEVLRAMSLYKLKAAVATTLAAAVVVAGATTLAGIKRPAPDEPAPPKAAAPRPQGERTITGTVLDDQNRFLAKAWVGADPRPMPDDWENPRVDNVREIATPFRDAGGRVVPAGAVGKYLEVRDAQGVWRPVNPDDVRPFEPIQFSGGKTVAKEETAKVYSPYSVRVGRGGWWMAGLPGVQDAARTDDQGRFTAKFQANGSDRNKLHFASGDYSLQAIRTIKADELDRPIVVKLRPTRLVRARVVEVPKDDPKAHLSWTAYEVDEAGKPFDEWRGWSLPKPNSDEPAHVKRLLEVQLPAGRWKVDFQSEKVRQLVDLTVPPGYGPIDLPEIRLEPLATARMVGNPAAEIEATDLEGRPVKLADHRGRYVVLDFWAHWCGPCIGAMPRLKAMQRRFRDYPVVILALHDASVAGAAEYHKLIDPIRRAAWAGQDLPFPVLLDRAPAAKASRAFSQGPGEKGSGRSADTYEVSTWPSTFLIDPEGKLVGRFKLDALESTLEGRFGLPSAQPAAARPPRSARDVKVSGKVVGPDSRGVKGAKLTPQFLVTRQDEIATDDHGDFSFMAERILMDHFFLGVEAPGLASKMFQLDSTGVAPGPLKLGVGAEVTGRVLRGGKPVSGVEMGLQQQQRHMDKYLGTFEARTDDLGRFRFEHVYADQDLYVYTKTGGLPDHAAIRPRACRSGDDGSTLDLGDFRVEPGRRLAGRVAFADGKAIPPGTKIQAWAEFGRGTIAATIDDRGGFEVLGLPETEVGVCLTFPGVNGYLPPGYRLSPLVKCASPINIFKIEGQLDRDIDDLTILFEPGPEPRTSLDPGRLADFKAVRAGTITGAPPGSVPGR